MFDALIRSLLGGWGTALLDFVLGHQLVISIVIVTAGIAAIIVKRKKQAAKTRKDKNREPDL